MNRLITMALVCLASLICAGNVSASESDALQVRVTIVTGEQSKDSSSETTTITVEGRSIRWERSASGGRRHRTGAPPKEKIFNLSYSDRENLLKLIRENGLLSTYSLELPLRPPVFYFELKIETTAGIEKGAVKISAPRSAMELKDKAQYRDSVPLLKELYRIMREQDKSMVFEELVRERP